MFTGLVQAVGIVRSAEPRDFGMRFVVDPGGWDYRPDGGDSVAVSGCCLTAIHPERRSEVAAEGDLIFDVVSETLRKTTLGSLKEGHRVNLEHAARADTLLGGHIVQGHVDALGEVIGITDDPGDWRMRVRAPDEAMQCIAPKGSVALEGVSLTIAGVESSESAPPRWFEVALIPTTLDLTNLRDRAVGEAVNIETDILARQTVHWLRHYASLNR